MKRFSRRGKAVPRRNYCCKPDVKIKESSVIEVLHSPPNIPKLKEKNVANRCCYITPNNRDFGQNYAYISPKYSKEAHVKQRSDLDQVSLTKDQYFCKPGTSTFTHLKELKEVSCDLSHKTKTSLQHTCQTSDNTSKCAAGSDGWCWQRVDGSDDVDKIFSGNEAPNIGCSSKQIFISEAPNVKVIAEKFSKYKRGNLELRKLDEKVVCVEYDIFNQSRNDKVLKPAQRMRAFFSIKPSLDNGSSEKQGLPTIPPNIKNEFDVLDEDLKKLTDKEIEFIDDMIEENKSYLEDLRRILKRKHVIKAQKNKKSLDLQSLYEMAIRDRPPLHCDFSGVNLLSKAELQEVKDLILQRCTSSVHGFRRKKIKQKERHLSPDIGVISESIMAELLAITKNLKV